MLKIILRDKTEIIADWVVFDTGSIDWTRVSLPYERGAGRIRFEDIAKIEAFGRSK